MCIRDSFQNRNASCLVNPRACRETTLVLAPTRRQSSVAVVGAGPAGLAAAGRADEINTCIACNQACLDHTFSNKTASCLVNPRACHETMLVLAPTRSKRSVAVVGAGPAGLAAAVSAAERGFAVTLFEKAPQIGGQFRLAMAVPGKEDFAETLRYYRRRLEVLGVEAVSYTHLTLPTICSV